MHLVVPERTPLDDRCLHLSLRDSTGARTALLDLSNATFIDPAGLVLIATTAARCVESGMRVSVTPPVNPSVCNYLDRMDLVRVLDDIGTNLDLRAVRRFKLGDRILTLRRIEGDDAADDLAEQVFRIFRHGSLHTARVLYDAIQEVAQNVLDHSGVGHGYIALQQYRSAAGTSEVAFAIGDAGIGLRASLSTRYRVHSDARAIRLAVRRGVTSVPDDPSRGVGLSSVVAVTGRHTGSVRLWSDAASSVFRGGTEVQAVERDVPYPGTMIVARIAAQ